PNQTPLIVDEAMQLRDWEPVTANWESGATIAGPTGFVFEPSPTLPPYEDMLVENGLFIGQVLAVPLTLSMEPPSTDIIYRGVRQEPSYTAVPPLESDTENIQRESHAGYR